MLQKERCGLFSPKWSHQIAFVLVYMDYCSLDIDRSMPRQRSFTPTWTLTRTSSSVPWWTSPWETTWRLLSSLPASAGAGSKYIAKCSARGGTVTLRTCRLVTISRAARGIHGLVSIFRRRHCYLVLGWNWYGFSNNSCSINRSFHGWTFFSFDERSVCKHLSTISYN